MARVFLTGGTGFLGSRVVAALARGGHSVAMLDRSAGNRSAPSVGEGGVTRVAGDLLEPDQYLDALRHADLVVHLAAATGRASEAEHQRVNGHGTETLVDACRRAGVERLLFTSTVATKFPDISTYHYARAKARAEAAIRASELRFTIVRPTIILGRGSATQAGLEKLAGLPVIPVFGSGGALVQPVFVDDVVEFLIAIIDEDRFDGETLDLGGPGVLTIEELLQTIRQARTGARGPLVHIPLGLALGLLNTAEAAGFSALLPVTAGQLSSFRFDGTIESNALYERRRSGFRGVTQMIA